MLGRKILDLISKLSSVKDKTWICLPCLATKITLHYYKKEKVNKSRR